MVIFHSYVNACQRVKETNVWRWHLFLQWASEFPINSSRIKKNMCVSICLDNVIFPIVLAYPTQPPTSKNRISLFWSPRITRITMGMHPSRSSSQKTPATISSGNQTLSDIANKHQQPRENCGGVQIIFWVKVIEGNGGRQRTHQQGSNDAQCGLCLKNISLKIDRRSMKSKPSSVTKFDSWNNNLLWSSIINHQSWINHLLPIINHHQNNHLLP